MEIVHLILGKANPNRMNGVNKVVYQLASRQALSKRDVSIWGVTKDLNHNYGERPFQTLLFLAHKNPFKIDKRLKSKLIEERHNIVVHLHGGWIPIYFSLAVFLKKHSIPFVLTPHGAYNEIAMRRNKLFKKIYFLFFERVLLKNVSKVHSLGVSEVDGLNRIYKNDKSILIPYGFELNPKDFHLKNDSTFLIGYVGRIDIFTKGLDILLNSFKEVENVFGDVQLQIVGDGSDLDKLKSLAKEMGINKIHFFGSKYDDEKNEIINNFDLFVHPSRNEGLPTAVIEAASFSVPSLVTEATNLGALLTKYNAGIVVENDDIPSFIDGLNLAHEFYKKKELKIKGKNALRLLTEEFNWDKVVNDFDKLYQVK